MRRKSLKSDVNRKLTFSPEAQADLVNLYAYIAETGGAQRASGYVQRIQAFCRSLQTFPSRGIRRDDLYPGLRVHGFERRASIAFVVGSETVTIIAILTGGRDLRSALSN